MRQRFILILCFLLLVYVKGISQIPIFEWASNQQYAGIFNETAITTDSSENVYFTGYFNAYHDFDPGPNTALEYSNGNNDAYLVKLDPLGNLQWYHTFGTAGENRGFSVFTDSLDNVYVSGIYGNTIDFDPGPGVYNLTPITGQSFGFIASYTPNGDFRWAHSLPGYLYGASLEEDEISYSPDGYILISDRFINTLDFDPGPGTFNMTSSSTSDMYVLKLDLDGNFIWARQFEGTYQRTPSIKGHSSGNIFVTGYYSGTIDLDPGTGVQNETALGFWDGFVIKLNSSGDLIFGKTFGGAQSDEPKEIDIDDQQNIYISGLFRGTADFDPGIGVQNFTSEGDEDPFLLKLDANGDFEWFHNYGGVNDDWKIAVEVDPAGNIYATGGFYDTVDFDPGLGISNQIAMVGGLDIFLTKVSSTGDLLWVKVFGGNGFSMGRSIHCTPSSNFYVCGIYDNIIDFNPGFGNAIYNSTGGNDGFNLKYSQCFQSPPVPDSSNLADVTGVCSVDSLMAPTATENCLGTVVGTPDVTFPITSIGTTVVTWTYDAGNGFITTQTQNVIIEDQQAPVPNLATLSDVTGICSVNSLTAPSATDNCSNSVTVSNDATFPILTNTTVTWTYDDNNGNTSTQTQNVIITPIDNSITLSNSIELEAVASGYNYQWLDCDTGNAPISGATNQSFIPTFNGNYAVEISNGTCTVVSNCIEISEVSLHENQIENVFSVFPNPTLGGVTIELNENDTVSHISIKDAKGRVVKFIDVAMNVFMYSLNLEGTSGIYFVEFVSADQTTSKVKLLKL